jgi:hypothetical protein
MTAVAEPAFEAEFWVQVELRASVVRRLALDELAEAEQGLLAEDLAVEDLAVLPIFTNQFWSGVVERAGSVRNQVFRDLAEAEALLAASEPVPAPTPDKAGHLPGRLRSARLPARPSLLGLARSKALAFGVALAAVLALLPQIIAPIWSLARLQPVRPPKFALIGDANSHATGEQEKGSAAERPGGSRAKPSASSVPRPGASGLPGVVSAGGKAGLEGGGTGSANAALGSTQNGSAAPGVSGASGVRPVATDPAPAPTTNPPTSTTDGTTTPVEAKPESRDCGQEGSLKAETTSEASAATIIFRNSSSRDVNLYQLDSQGQRVLETALPPGVRHVQPTFLTQPWVIATPEGPCLAIYLPVPGRSTAVFKG